MSGMKKAASSIGRTMTHRVDMSQVGLSIMARDISKDRPEHCNVGVIARTYPLNRKFQEIVAGRCCELHTLLSDYIHQISGVGQKSHSILQISQITHQSTCYHVCKRSCVSPRYED